MTKEKDYRDVDGLITNVPGLILGTFYADCVPLLFVDPVHHAIGCSHSGWRGTVGEMGKRQSKRCARRMEAFRRIFCGDWSVDLSGLL